MKVNDQLVQRIGKSSIGKNCVQVMVPYKKSLTILSKDNILYHDVRGVLFHVNKYLNDDRRNQFVYSNIPIHRSRVGLFMYNYTNQIFNFEEPYIRISDGHIIESFAVKDNDSALLMNRVLSKFTNTEYKVKEELDEMLKKPIRPDENLYIMSLDGNFYSKENLYSDISLTGQGNILLIRTNGKDIIIKKLFISSILRDCYRVDILDIPVTKYSLEHLKFFSTKIIDLKKSNKILQSSLGVLEEDFIVNKKLVKAKSNKGYL